MNTPIEPPSAAMTVAQSQTPEASRNESISTLLASAYAKASTLTLTPEESAALTQEFPDDAIRSGARGDENHLYIEHAFIRQRMMEVFGPGQWAVINRRAWLDDVAGWLYADVVLLVRGCFVGECIGAMRYGGTNKRMNYADALKGAESEAIGRIAGTQLGVGLQLWKRGFCDGWKQRQASGTATTGATPAPSAPQTPKAATEVTRQWAIAGLAKAGGTAADMDAYIKWSGQGESAATWDLTKVPTSRQALATVCDQYAHFLKGVAPAATAAPLNKEEFWNAVITVPRAGVKRDDYLKAPDTIQSLYVATKAGDAKARARLFGLVGEWQPSTFVGADGNEQPPRPEDVACRAALDAFAAWREGRPA